MKKTISFILALLLAASLCTGFVYAADTKEVKMLSYNVAGLPSISGIIGMQGADVAGNQRQLGKLLNKSGYDVIAVQEDFGYHCLLAGGLTKYSYKTDHSGGIPGGDGMNIFSKYRIFNAKRTAWDTTYGVINDGADELTPKGILYSVIDLGDGIYADFYVIHADAFDGAGSIAARKDNFRQLSEMILARGTNRPVIVTGDFNTSSHLAQGADFTRYMIGDCGMTDAWTALYNCNDYSDYSRAYAQYGSSYYGVWDSLEKFLYRDGGGIHIEAETFEYVTIRNSSGESISDHNAAAVTLRFSKTGSYAPNTDKMRVTHIDLLGAIRNKIVVTLTDLRKIAAHADELIALLK